MIPIPLDPLKAMCDPSGDQDGSVAKSELRLWRPEPSALMSQMFHVPFRVLANAIWLPSGDQAGLLSSQHVLSGVSAVCPLPSAFITQMRKRSPPVPLRRSYAIFVPSGDQS